MKVNKQRVIEVVKMFTEVKHNGKQVDWKKVIHTLNDEFGINKGRDFYRSIYRRETNDPSYNPNKAHSEAKPLQDDNILGNKEKKHISIETSSDGVQKSEILVNIVSNPMKQPEQILRTHGYDVTQWELINHRLSLWNAYSKQDGTHELYASKLTVKPIQFAITEQSINNLIGKMVDKHFINHSFYERYTLEKHESRKMAELAIFDLHLGKLAWREETEEDYDLTIATERYRYVLDEMLDEVRYEGIEKILLPFGNDFFHFDNENNTTTKGTPQDSDTRMAKMFDRGVDLVIETIQKCLEIADVEFVYVKSNHDATIGYYANVVIDRLYKNNPQVTLHTRPKSRNYIEYGNCLIGYTHGDKEKKNLTTLMQSEVPEIWGRTKYREWHIGHFHHLKVQEHNGLVIQTMPSISGTDKYHYDAGYTGSLKRAVCIIWDYEKGKKREIYVNID